MEELAKILVLGVLVALVMAYITAGPEGAKAWFRAKYLGEPDPTKAQGYRRGKR